MYSQFKTLGSVKEAFGITTKEGVRFLPQLSPLVPSQMLQDFLEYGMPIATATGSEKVRSELLISPVLLEVHFLTSLCRPWQISSNIEAALRSDRYDRRQITTVQKF
jgi:hypothetical protein